MQNKTSIWFIDENYDGSTGCYQFIGTSKDLSDILERRANTCIAHFSAEESLDIKIETENDSVQASAGITHSYFCEATDVNMLPELSNSRRA